MSVQLEAGTILLNKYRVEAAIGQGGFGAVYSATDTLLKRTIAVKTLVHEKTDPANEANQEVFAEFLDRFQREAQVSAYFTANPNIITVYGLEQDEEQNYYLLIEYLDGGSLDKMIGDQGKLSVAQTCSITLDLCHALIDIHNHPADIVHRDIKPSNVLLRSKGTAVLADFGIAQVGHDSHRTQMGDNLKPLRHPGSPPYRSPEQAQGYDYLTPASDLYSLGLVIYEMLTGRMYVKNPKMPPSSVVKDIPPWLDQIVAKLLQRKIEDRYQQAEEVSDAIQNGLTGSNASPEDTVTIVANGYANPLKGKLIEAERARQNQTGRLTRPATPEEEQLRQREEAEKLRREREIERQTREFDEWLRLSQSREAIEKAEQQQRDDEEARRRREEEAAERQRQEQELALERRRQEETDRLLTEYTAQMAYFELRMDWNMTIELARSILELSPHHPQTVKRLLEAYKARARLLYSQGKYDAAILDLKASLELNMDDADSYYELGLCSYQKHEYDRALLDLNRALELNPNPGSYYYSRGLIYHQKQDYHRAITDFGRAIMREPTKAIYYFQRGLSYDWRGANFYNKDDQEAALADFNRAVQLDPTKPIYYYYRALSYRKQSDLAQSNADLGQAIQLDDKQADYYFQRGLNSVKLKAYDAALTDFNRAIELDPRQAGYYYYRGLTYRTKKDRKSAKRDLQIAVDMGHSAAKTDLANL